MFTILEINPGDAGCCGGGEVRADDGAVTAAKWPFFLGSATLRIVRAIGSITAAALAAGFLLAPFTHVHAAGAAEEHMEQEHSGSLALHMHVGSESEGSSLRLLEDSALQLDWFVLEELDGPQLLAVLVSNDSLQPPAKASTLPAHQATPVHYPPGLGRSTPRGPPA